MSFRATVRPEQFSDCDGGAPQVPLTKSHVAHFALECLASWRDSGVARWRLEVLNVVSCNSKA